jgi:hypothetical protein
MKALRKFDILLWNVVALFDTLYGLTGALRKNLKELTPSIQNEKGHSLNKYKEQFVIV